jgi:hypothetical protein
VARFPPTVTALEPLSSKSLPVLQPYQYLPFCRTCLGSTFGNCCSQYGYCGSSTDHCGTGCNTAFGNCGGNGAATSAKPAATSAKPAATSTKPATPTATAAKVSVDGACGGTAKTTCQGSTFGNCCSQYGYCGKTATYCGTGCNKAFGTCSTTTARGPKVPTFRFPF